MSREFDVMLEMQEARMRAKQQRDEANRERVRISTSSFLARYKERLNNMKSEGLDQFISLNALETDIINAESNLFTDPFYAREISFSIGSYINELERNAKDIKKDQIALNKDELSDFYYSEIRNISDSLVIEFAKDELKEIKGNLKNYSGANLDNYKRDMREKIMEATKNAKIKAEEYRRKKEKEVIREQAQIDLDNMENEIKKQNIDCENNKKKQEEILKQILMAKKALDDSNIEIGEIKNTINMTQSQTNEFLIDEETRREVVKSIINSLKLQEFDITKTALNEYGEVLINAKRPSGKKASCKIALNGKMTYRFDHYEGQTCVKDIEKFEKDMEQIYSIKFNDRKQTWENPDRISKNAKDINQEDKKTL